MFFHDLWKPLLSDYRIVILFRDYKSVVDSLIQRDRKIRLQHPSQNMMAWLRKQYHLHFKGPIYPHDADGYLNLWIEYNRRCLQLISEHSENQAIALKIEDLLKEAPNIFEYLRNDWTLDIEFTDPRELWRKSSSRQTTLNFTNDRLVREADKIFSELNRRRHVLNSLAPK